jgi:ABC-2 type transport system permease protein
LFDCQVFLLHNNTNYSNPCRSRKFFTPPQPSPLFPQSLLELAQYNPIYHRNEALMGVWADGKDLADIAEHFWYLFIFSIAMIAGGWLSYRRMLRVERRL